MVDKQPHFGFFGIIGTQPNNLATWQTLATYLLIYNKIKIMSQKNPSDHYVDNLNTFQLVVDIYIQYLELYTDCGDNLIANRFHKYCKEMEVF